MLPREWFQLYGLPTVRRLNIDAGGKVVIDSNLDRYLLGFLDADPSAIAYPDSAATLAGIGFDISSTKTPILLTHALHGALVNMAWSVFSPGPAAFVTVVEGFASGRQLTVVNGTKNGATGRARVGRR